MQHYTHNAKHIYCMMISQKFILKKWYILIQVSLVRITLLISRYLTVTLISVFNEHALLVIWPIDNWKTFLLFYIINFLNSIIFGWLANWKLQYISLFQFKHVLYSIIVGWQTKWQFQEISSFYTNIFFIPFRMKKENLV